MFYTESTELYSVQENVTTTSTITMLITRQTVITLEVYRLKSAKPESGCLLALGSRVKEVERGVHRVESGVQTVESEVQEVESRIQRVESRG